MDTLAALQFGLAPALASALLHALWQDALLGVAAWLTLASMARSSAAMRHTVAMGFLLAMVLVPASTFLRFWQLAPLEVNAGVLEAITVPRLDAAGLFVQQSSPVAAVLALLWLAGVGVMLLRRFGGWWLVAALDRQPYERLPADWQRCVERLRDAMGITRDVAVRLSAEVVGPFTARLLRPVVWLPLSMLTQLPREQLEALLAHELAHVARLDWLWNGLQCVIESLLFFHPAAWWLGRRIRQEREHACDDLAVMACGDAIALAEALVQIERERHPAPPLVLAAHGGSLMKRITRLIAGTPTRSRWGALAGLAVVLAAGAVFASQVLATRPGIRIVSTTDGALRPGDSREITANGIDGRRYYHGSVDAQGRLTEVYREDGRVRPIDAGVRAWLAEVDRLAVPPAPPVPPPPPPAPLVSAPPAPPAPPPPPEMADDAAFKALLGQVVSDARAIRRLGSPLAMASRDVRGRIEIDDATAPDGEADLRFDLVGPQGRATVHVEAELDAGRWSVGTLEFVEPAR